MTGVMLEKMHSAGGMVYVEESTLRVHVLFIPERREVPEYRCVHSIPWDPVFPVTIIVLCSTECENPREAT